jgi:hypothetical protein
VLVFIDDSGDAGFKIGQGSSKSLVIACCVFEAHQSAESTAEAIRSYRHTLGWHPLQEFKFSKTRSDIRRGFMEAVRAQDFFVRAVIMQKGKIYSAHLQQDHRSFYNYAIQTVLSNSNGTIRDASIKIDGSGDRTYKKAAIAYLRREVNKRSGGGVVRKAGFVDSKGDQLIQLADMVAGAIRHSVDSDRADAGDYRGLLTPRLVRDRRSDVWDWGR